jgi:hypothetical protein
MTKAITPRTNGDRVQPFVDRGRKLLAETVRWAREHPDEVAVSAAPLLMLATATRRHPLGWAEAALVAEVGYWSGVAMCAQYRQWKTRPARPSLKEVT